MVISTSVEISHKHEDGWHIFESDQMPGFYVANRDPRRAFEAVGPTIEQLVRLDTGIECRASPAVPFDEFIGSVRAEICAERSKHRFTILKEAA